MTPREKALAIIEMMKPKQLALLMLTMYGAYFAAGEGASLRDLILLTIVGFGGIGGVTALNMYLEADIDRIMNRTRKRPLPSGKLDSREAFMWILALIIAGLAAALAINKYVAFALLAGFYFDIITYTELTKRFSISSLILGSFAGSMPALGGWAAGEGAITLGGILLAGIVFVWQPMHVSFLAYYFLEDYKRAGIPSLPAALPGRQFRILVAASILMLPVLAWAFVAVEGYGYIAAVLTTIASINAAVKVITFDGPPGSKMAAYMIKYASPLVAIVFLALPIDAAITESIVEVLAR